MIGPLHRAFQRSYLASSIRAGLQAVPGDKRKHIADAIRADFSDSLDLDDATRQRHPHDARWDYLLGHDSSSHIVAIETHSAETSEVSKVIQKRRASLQHIRGELGSQHHVAAWYWAASGRVDFVPHERTMLRLSENGIQFVGGRLEAKHLASLSGPAPRTRTSPKPRRKR